MATPRGQEPRPLIAGLAPFYDAIRPVGWTLVRVTAGLTMLPIGWTKLQNGLPAVVKTMEKWSVTPHEPMAAVVMMNETLGALCVALGLFTRFFAASLAIQMAVLVWLMSSGGYNAYRLFLLWGLVYLAIWIRGGGPWSLDRVIGKEL